MSMFREQLILRALAALSEIADECGERPSARNLSLRFLLAYTFVAAGGDASKKWIWNDFWKHATKPRTDVVHEQFLDDYVRGTGARSALTGICREVGYDTDGDFLKMLRDHRKLRELPKHGPRPLEHDNDEPRDDDAA